MKDIFMLIDLNYGIIIQSFKINNSNKYIINLNKLLVITNNNPSERLIKFIEYSLLFNINNNFNFFINSIKNYNDNDNDEISIYILDDYYKKIDLNNFIPISLLFNNFKIKNDKNIILKQINLFNIKFKIKNKNLFLNVFKNILDNINYINKFHSFILLDKNNNLIDGTFNYLKNLIINDLNDRITVFKINNDEINNDEINNDEINNDEILNEIKNILDEKNLFSFQSLFNYKYNVNELKENIIFKLKFILNIK